jgi:hypothetical protein
MMPSEFKFILGASAIEADKMLKSDPKTGKGQLHSMHEYVVNGLAALDGKGKTLEQRWG